MDVIRIIARLVSSALVILSLSLWLRVAYAGDDEPVMVAIPDKNYAIGKYEVTQNEWRSVMGSDPPGLRFTTCGNTCPVEKVSWNDIQEFIEKLNAKTGKQYRLPTEAEWEYACYGGSQSEYCGGNDPGAVAWYKGNSNDQTHPVGRKQANGYGLYDMTGNVWEWMSDCYSSDCTKRVLRGGSWFNGLHGAHAAYRLGDDPMFRGSSFGFRLARSLPQPGADDPVMVPIPGKDYELGKFDITRGEFAKFVSETGYDAGDSCWVWEDAKWDNRSGSNWRNPGFAQDENHPVTCVSWDDAQAYISWLSKKTGNQYRLPTETEWEYACYGNIRSKFCGGNNIDSVAWYEGNSSMATHHVGEKPANGYGLCDMSGNVWQWMENTYDDINDWRALRGGSWSVGPQVVRAVNRDFITPAGRLNGNGFRLARTLP